MAINNENWSEKFKKGKSGEIAVMQMLDNSGIKYKDMSDNEDFKRIDIDLLLQDYITLEIKTDTTYPYYNNIFLEMENCKPTGVRQGWYYHTMARYILVYGGHGWQDQYLIFDFRKLKELIERKEIGYYKKWYNSEEKEYQSGWIVPIDRLKQYEDIYLMDGQTTEIIDCSLLFDKLKGLKGSENKVSIGIRNSKMELDKDFIF